MTTPNDVEISVFAKDEGQPLTKTLSLVDGKLKPDASDCRMMCGTAWRTQITDISELAGLIEAFEPYNALALGTLRPDLPDEVTVVTKRMLNGDAGVIARTADNFVFRPGKPAVTLFDFDSKGMPREVIARLRELGSFEAALASIVSALDATAYLVRASTSAGLVRTDTDPHRKVAGSDGRHILALIADGGDSARFLQNLHERAWLAGLGWYMVGTGGQLLERSVIDRMVGSPERLVFEGPPIIRPPLAQSADARRPRVHNGDPLDTKAACPPLTAAEQAELQRLKAQAREALQGKAAAARATYVESRADELAQRTGMGVDAARRIIEAQADGILHADVILPFDDLELAGKTVRDVLADPDAFVGETLSDPIEGPSYGRGKAKVMRRRSGEMWINSFAHGRTRYRLIGDPKQLPERVELADFHALMTEHKYVFAPSRDLWPAVSVNNRIPPVPLYGSDGQPLVDDKGKPKTLKAAQWLDTYAPVEQMTWAPGRPMLIADKLISEGGWIDRRGVQVFNLYRPPTLEPDNADKADRWLDHVHKVYPDDVVHIINWLAHRVQHPEDKINHALFLGGAQGIGKDSLLEPVKRAVGRGISPRSRPLR